MNNFYEFTFPEHVDGRGALVPYDFGEGFPFVPKRVYVLHHTPVSITRGAHCHHKEEEVFVCLAGKVLAHIDSDGKGKKKTWLDSPTKAIFVGKKVWHEFSDFSEGSVLLCFSSVHYMPGESNYEYEYSKFLEYWKR